MKSLSLGNEKSARSFSDRSFCMDVRTGCRCQSACLSQDLEGLTEVFGRMSAGISGQKLPLWADFSFLTLSLSGPMRAQKLCSSDVFVFCTPNTAKAHVLPAPVLDKNRSEPYTTPSKRPRGLSKPSENQLSSESLWEGCAWNAQGKMWLLFVGSETSCFVPSELTCV